MTTTTAGTPGWPWVVRAAPGVVLGAYAARLAGELIGLPGWWAAVGLTLVLAAGGAWLLGRRLLRQTWPALVLLVYVVYPEPDLALGVFVGVIAVVTWSQSFVTRHGLGQGRWLRVAGLAGVALAALWLYVRTVAPDVLPADSGELQVVAATLGVAHPPGFPLYVLLGHLWTLLPFGAGPAYRLNLFSAVTSTLTLMVVYQTVVVLARRRPLLAGWTAAVALGTATTFWAQATTANIRSLTALFTALALYCLVRFGQAVRAEDGRRNTADRWLILAALALGFGTTHHVSLAFLALIGVVYVLLADRTLWRTPRRWVWPVLAGLAGLLPLLYLPWRANSGARGTSPQLATLDGFLEHVLAIGFRGDLFYFTDPVLFWDRLRVMANILTFQFVPVILLGVAVGLALLLLRNRLLALLFGGTAVVFTLVAATYRAPQTVEYLMPAYVALTLGLGYAAGNLPRAMGRPGRLETAASELFVALLLVSGVNQGLQHFSSYDALHRDTTARDVAGQLLDEAPLTTTILAHWHWVTPLWYLQEVEGLRPDVSSRFVFPEGEPYANTWARRVAEASEDDRPVISTFYDPALFSAGPPEPLGEAYLFRPVPLEVLPSGYEPLSLTWGGRVEVVGYRQDEARVQAGDPLVLTLAWRPVTAVPDGLTLFAHLVGPDGRTYGQADVPVQPQPEGLSLTQLRVVPRPGTPLGTLAIAVGAYVGGETLPDAGGEARTPISNAAVVANSLPPFTQQPLARHELSAAGRALVGYDWDRTLPDRPRLYLHWQLPEGYWTEVRDAETAAAEELVDLPPYRGLWGVPVPFWQVPSYANAGLYVPFAAGIVWTGDALTGDRYAPGETLTLDQVLHGDRPVMRDYVVSTRLIGLAGDGSQWAWWDLVDGIPGLGAVPTLKWIHGSTVLSPYRLTVDPAAADGQELTGALTIYDAFTNRPLPLLDERLADEFGWVPLGGATVDR